MTRVLILTASVGEGHDLPARTLADQLRDEDPTVEVVTEDGLRVMGRPFVLLNERAPGVVFFRFQWLWDAALGLYRWYRACCSRYGRSNSRPFRLYETGSRV